MNQQTQYPSDKKEAYLTFLKILPDLLDPKLPLISNLSNLSALLNQLLTDINWVGFYLVQADQLYLGPFQGQPACTVIDFGKGVCGTAIQSKETQLVMDVHQFPGHIACDANSRSEIVIPIFDENQLYGVLDIDSPSLGRFDDVDQQYLEMVVQENVLPLFQGVKSQWI